MYIIYAINVKKLLKIGQLLQTGYGLNLVMVKQVTTRTKRMKKSDGLLGSLDNFLGNVL
jgi:hypothetical protein